MGQSHSLAAQAEIQAPPATVRSVFMDFPRYKQWCSWTIDPVESGKKSSDLKPGDRLNVSVKGTKFSPVIQETSPETFVWEGNMYGLLIGRHYFSFVQSSKTPGGTTVSQSEEFRGLLAFMFAPGWSMRKKTEDGWNEFFAGLKKEAEKSTSS